MTDDPAAGASRPAIAVVGLGLMGGQVAARYASREYVTTGYDPNEQARGRAATAGVAVSESLSGAVAEAEVILTSLPHSPAVTDVWVGEGGLLEVARPGAVLVELSTIDPFTMQKVAERATAAGYSVIDCPVSGGPEMALNGTLILMTGGDLDVIDRVRPALEEIGTISITGDIGTPKTIKLVNNMMSMGNLFVAAEAFSVGVEAGVDPQQLFDILAISGGRSHHFLKRFPRALAGDFTPGFALNTAEKDLRLGVELATSVGIDVPTARAVWGLCGEARRRGLGGEDTISILRLFSSYFERLAAASRSST